ncbi:MAG: hypothetical protein LBD59_03515 [Prevotellaceae bacterium]|jgi:hypothetical protein|nr:hypothetical protein [Prevotellaceae bacterium]
MKKFLFIICLWLCTVAAKSQTGTNAKNGEKTGFQTASMWKPSIDVRADVAIIYGVGGNPSDKGRQEQFERRVKSWRDRGYTVHFMGGIAWGSYADYFTGQWDGKPHLDEGQKTVNGDTIWHGRMTPYIVPSKNFLHYIKEMHIRRVIDAGIDAIYMEEPEFWMRAGYSEAFRREWLEYYGFPWRPQHESPENTYLSNKLKYHLYYRALEEVFTYAKEYGKSKGMNVRCYVPTHSLVNYSSWAIVSPEASLASLPCVDGYIAQVWTGTSREATFYNGVRRERVFENAFLEYGSMESMTRPTGRKMFFLTDPIEDRARDWDDYKLNYQATFVAQLLYPSIANYEVMPWPGRIYEGLYKTCASCETKEQIPRFYSTQMQVMINTLNDMPQSDNRVSGSQGIGVLMSNSLMFQRFPDHAGYDDPQFSNFYGQTLPLLKRGVPVATVHAENVAIPDTWRDLKVLVISYSNMKPMTPDCHRHIAQWVRDGGRLVYCGKDVDPYQSVMEWWNSDGNRYAAPSEHLFEMLGLATRTPATGEYRCGKGTVYVMREEPKEFVLNAGGDREYIETVSRAWLAATGNALQTKNSLTLERGAYLIAAVMDESVSDEPLELKGLYIDLFDPELPVLRTKTVKPGEQTFLYNLAGVNKKRPKMLCGASRIYNETVKRRSYSFTAKSPANTNNVSRVLLPQKPKSVKINQSPANFSWDDASNTCLLKFENSPDGVEVEIDF